MRNVWVVSRKQVASAGFVALGWKRARIHDEDERNPAAALGRRCCADSSKRSTCGRKDASTDRACSCCAAAWRSRSRFQLPRQRQHLDADGARRQYRRGMGGGLILSTRVRTREQRRSGRGATVGSADQGPAGRGADQRRQPYRLGAAPQAGAGPTGMRLIRDCDDLWATGPTVPDAT